MQIREKEKRQISNFGNKRSNITKDFTDIKRPIRGYYVSTPENQSM